MDKILNTLKALGNIIDTDRSIFLREVDILCKIMEKENLKYEIQIPAQMLNASPTTAKGGDLKVAMNAASKKWSEENNGMKYTGVMYAFLCSGGLKVSLHPQDAPKSVRHKLRFAAISLEPRACMVWPENTKIPST